MGFKDIWSKVSKPFQVGAMPKAEDFHVDIDEHGLMSGGAEHKEAEAEAEEVVEAAEKHEEEKQEEPAVVSLKRNEGGEKNQSIERLEEGFNSLIKQLEGINENLRRQSERHEQLMSQINKLPDFMENLPSVVRNQQELSERILEKLKEDGVRNERMREALGRIPEAADKQTEAIEEMSERISDSVDADAKMAECFEKFNGTLAQFDATSAGQTDSILQMSKTFSASDRYLKHLMTQQNKRFMWIFFTALGVCSLAILFLVMVVIHLKP